MVYSSFLVQTNQEVSIIHTSAVATGLSGFHRLVLSFLRVHFKRFPTKKIIYRYYHGTIIRAGTTFKKILL